MSKIRKTKLDNNREERRSFMGKTAAIASSFVLGVFGYSAPVRAAQPVDCNLCLASSDTCSCSPGFKWMWCLPDQLNCTFFSCEECFIPNFPPTGNNCVGVFCSRKKKLGAIPNCMPELTPG